MGTTVSMSTRRVCDEWYSPECAQETAYAALRIERNNVAQVEEACRANYIVAHPAARGLGYCHSA